MTKERKVAGGFSLLAAVGNLGAIAVIINAANINEFLLILPNSPKVALLLISGVLSMIIGLIILFKREINQTTRMITLLVSAGVFVIAAIQMSIALLFVLPWPWSLYKLYKTENA